MNREIETPKSDSGELERAGWFESAERDYAFGSYAFFGEEWGEKLIEEVKRLRDIASLFERLQNRIAELERQIASEESHAKTCVSCRALAVTMGVCFSCGFIQNAASNLIERLRSTALTREEALAVLDVLVHRGACRIWDKGDESDCNCSRGPIRAKLSRVAAELERSTSGA